MTAFTGLGVPNCLSSTLLFLTKIGALCSCCQPEVSEGDVLSLISCHDCSKFKIRLHMGASAAPVNLTPSFTAVRAIFRNLLGL